MKINLLVIGKIKEKWIQLGIDEYIKRLTPMAQIRVIEEGEEKLLSLDSPLLKEKCMNKEAERLLKYVNPKDYVVLLDTKGKEISSEQLAEWMQDKMVTGTGQFYFMIGGPFGNGSVLRDRANMKISMGPMTFTHRMARLILLEQLYRAMKINRHEPYHL